VDAVTRRKFLIGGGIVAAGALAAGATAYSLWEYLATAGDPGPAPDARTLVTVTLYGGNDGLATVIPFGDSAYQDARPHLAYGPDQVLRLDGATGLNPALKGMHDLYQGGRLAIVRGVGYPKPEHSHFRSMDIWQTASPDRPVTTGWLGRWLDSAGGDPRLAVSFEPVLPPLLAGESSAGAAVSVGAQSVVRPATAPVIKDLGTPSAGEPALRARAAASFANLVKIDEMITTVRQASSDEATPDATGATGTGGASSPLAAQLDLVARCVEAGVATRVFSVSLGGFDFHANEKTAQERLLGVLDQAVSGFLTRMARSDRGRQVVVLIYSEFGRRVRANASSGTDHGTASNVLVAGPAVHGGLIGDQPSLRDLDDGDLKYHTDFRDIYATLLAEVLDADPVRVLNGWSGTLPGLLRQPGT
jgi:uncharacterized protein (DUF1501 family)